MAFLLGVVAASRLPVLPDPKWLGLLLLPPVIWFGRRAEWARVVAVFLFGGLWLIGYVGLLSPVALPAAVDGRTLTVTGQIVSIPRRNEQRGRFDFRIHKVHSVQTDWRGKVRLSWYHPEHALRAGQLWRLKIKLKPVHGFANPGGFDYEASLFRQAIGATGYVRDTASARLISRTTTLHSLRQSLSEGIRLAMPGSRHGSLLVALATGDRQFIDQRQWRVMTRTGTLHLMAISGLHVGLVYGLFFFLGRRLWRTGARLCLLAPAQDVAVVTGLIAAIVYAAMAGFSIPTQRALIMLAVVAAAALGRRLTSPTDVLQAALLLVLLLDPLAVLSAGFWLSFAAVAVILLTLEREHKAAAPVPAWYRLVRIQWVLVLGLLPLTSLFFYQVSVVAPVMNLLAVPLVGLVVVPLALTGTVLAVVLPLPAQWILGLADGLMQWLWLLLEAASNSPYAVVHPPHPSLWILFFVVPGVVLALFHRKTAYRLMGLLLLTPLFLSAVSPVSQRGFQVDVLDVGQGLAVVVRTARHTLLYDTGFSNDSGFDLGRRVILPYLWHEGITLLDRVVLSHDDRDHAGGYASVSREVAVRQLTVMPGSQYLTVASATACRAGERWRWDGVDFQFLHPRQDGGGKGNDNSCVLKVSADSGSVLLTGDIEKSAERSLVSHAPGQLAADILLAPHHGSETSSTREFINAVKPREVVYSSGYRNRFGFPRAAVVARYAEAGAEQWNTADTGMLRYRFGRQAGAYQRWAYRQARRRFWRP